MDLFTTTAELENTTSAVSTLIVAFSGGADSLLALELAAEIAAINPNQRLMAWYCHHYSAPIEPERQSIFDETTKKLSATLGNRWRFVLHKADIDRIARRLGYSWEHTASLVRRKYLLRLADRYESAGRAAVITGHNYSDFLETLALRRARQIPEAALPALTFADAHTGFLRPLCRLTREQVRTAATERGLTVYEDPANSDMQFARNRIRVSAAGAAAHPAVPAATAAQSAAPRRRHRRELRLPASAWDNMQSAERARTVFSAFRSLAIVKKFTRNHFARAHKLPFRLPPFFAHKENTAAGDAVVFRRGLGEQVSLPQPDASPCLRGDQVSRRITIATPCGHKSISKIFSESKLSARERRRALVYLSAPRSSLAVRLVLPERASL